MQLYNSLTKKVEDFKPLNDNEVRIYSCGPTVYDHAHIGNLSAYIFADTLHRALKLAGYKIKHVMNYTDVDDKTIKKSQQSKIDDPQAALKAITDHYISLFLDDMKKIGNDVDSINFVRATDYIEKIKDHISKLVDAGYAYISDDGIYFSIAKYRESGKKYGQLIEITQANTSEARIQNDEYDKDNVHDFALWKKVKPGEPSWEFNIGDIDMEGRPGWHIECSVMSEDTLGLPFDIHTGGVDLKFPHHENEIAQSTALTDNPTMATYFAHNNHILVDGKKMSKSANNFFTLQNILDNHISPVVFRMMVLQGHYLNQLNFSWDSLQTARTSLQHIKNNFSWIYQSKVSANTAVHVSLENFFNSSRIEIKKALLNDLDTPGAIAALHHQSQVFATMPGSRLDKKLVEDYSKFIESTLGFSILDELKLGDNLQRMINQRLEARKKGDWMMADKIRDELLERHKIGLKDTEEGTQWYQV